MRARALSLVFGLVALAVVLFSSRDAHAYGFMLRHEYGGCIQCHADPSGGGLLTTYGRVQSETLLRTHYGKQNEEEEPTLGNFAWGLYKADDKDTVLLGADLRELYFDVKPDGTPATSKFLFMQADFAAQVHVKRYIANASIGYAAEGALPASLTRAPEKNLVSRVHWLGAELGEDNQYMIRAGRMNLPFGLRTIEHTLWTRVATRSDTNSGQQDGVAFAYNGEKFRGEVMAILGNFQLRPWSYHEYGYSAYGEWSPRKKLAVGLSSLVTHADLDVSAAAPYWRQAHGVFGRYSPIRSVELSAEQNLTVGSQPGSALVPHNNVYGTSGYLTADFEPLQGLHLLLTGEDQVSDLSRSGTSLGVWAGAWWFFLPHADLRADVIYQSLAVSNTHLGVTTFLLQAHVFL